MAEARPARSLWITARDPSAKLSGQLHPNPLRSPGNVANRRKRYVIATVLCCTYRYWRDGFLGVSGPRERASLSLGRRHAGCFAHPYPLPCLSNFLEKIGMPVEHLEQLHQRHRRFSLAALVPAERIRASAKDLGGLLLGEFEQLPDLGEQVDGGQLGVHLLVELEHLLRRSHRLAQFHDDLPALRVVAESALDRLDERPLPLVRIGNVPYSFHELHPRGGSADYLIISSCHTLWSACEVMLL